MLIDQAKIYVIAGSGGNGCQSLYKDLFNRKGTPDGGSGGNGGDVIVESDPNLHTLLDFRYNQHYRAGRGKHGGSNNKVGRCGEDRIIKVPVGTIVKDAENGLVVRDLACDDERVVVVRGGGGGKGNAGRGVATEGKEGETRTLLLELKLVADAGIIGFPNAGKSTMICRISKAHSKIAAYPFTTRSPRLGVVKTHGDSFVAADMPGLIEGAHEGRGLGDRFLRHIERTAVLVHVIDMAPIEGTDPSKNYVKLEKELEMYGMHVYDKPRILVANKMDIPGAEENLKKFSDVFGEKIWSVSALTGEGLADLIQAIYRKVKDVRKEDKEDNYQDRDESPDGQQQ